MFTRICSMLIAIVILSALTVGKDVGIVAQTQALTETPTTQPSLNSTITSVNALSILPQNVWRISGIPRSLVFSPNGSVLAAGLSDNTIQLWNAISRKESAILEGHADEVNAIVFNPDGTLLASASRDKTIHLWRSDSGLIKFVLKGHTGEVKKLAFSSDGRFLASSGDIEAILWDVSTGTQNIILKSGVENTPYLVAFSPKGNLLAVGSRSGIDLWDVASGIIKQTLECPGAPQDIGFSPDGTIFACGTATGHIYIWDAVSNKELFTFQIEDAAKMIGFDPFGRYLVVVGNTTVSLWNLTTHQPIPIPNHDCSFISNAVFNLDASILAYGGYCGKVESGFVEMDDTSTGKELVRQKTEGLIYNVLFNPTSTLFVSAEGGHVTIWGLKSQK